MKKLRQAKTSAKQRQMCGWMTVRLIALTNKCYFLFFWSCVVFFGQISQMCLTLIIFFTFLCLCCFNECADSVRVFSLLEAQYIHKDAGAKMPLFGLFQCDQQSSRSETGGGDADVFVETHWQHRGHLLCLLHYLWNLGSAGELVEGRAQKMLKTKTISKAAKWFGTVAVPKGQPWLQHSIIQHHSEQGVHTEHSCQENKFHGLMKPLLNFLVLILSTMFRGNQE